MFCPQHATSPPRCCFARTLTRRSVVAFHAAQARIDAFLRRLYDHSDKYMRALNQVRSCPFPAWPEVVRSSRHILHQKL